MSDDNEQLIRRLAAGDNDAFTETYMSYKDAIGKVINGKVPIHYDNVEAFVSEVFAEALASVRRGSLPRGDIGAWLYGIGRNKIKRWYTKGTPLRDQVSLDGHDQSDNEVPDETDFELVRELMS